MNYSYEEQALAVDTVTRIKGSAFDIALREAKATLNAAALTKEKLSITEDLIKLSQEFVMDTPSMDLTELVQYQNEFRKILDKLK